MINLKNHNWKSFKEEFPDVNNPEHATAIICMWRYEAEECPNEYEYCCFNLGFNEGLGTLLWSVSPHNNSDYYSKINHPDYEYWDYLK